MVQGVSTPASLPEAILDGLADRVLEVDARGRIRYANRAAARVSTLSLAARRHQIVRAHGGSIVAESDASGTRFRVKLTR